MCGRIFLNVVVLPVLLTGCAGDLVIPPSAWQTFYTAEQYKIQAVAGVRYLGVVGTTLTTIDQGLGSSNKAINCAPQGGSQPDQLTPDVLADYCNMRDAYNTGRQAYNDARAKWNAWIGTIILIISSNSNIQDWPDYKQNIARAMEASTAFFNSLPPQDNRLARNNLDVLRAWAVSQNLPSQAQSVTAKANVQFYEFGATAPGPSSGNPLDLVVPLLNFATTLQAERDKLNADARSRLVAELGKRTWDEYDCILDKNACRSSQPGAPQPGKTPLP